MALRRLTVFLHADDFGMNRSVTDGILECFTSGLLTSTSILANAPAFEYAVAGWHRLEKDRAGCQLEPNRLRSQLLDDVRLPYDLGVHLNLTQGRPLTRAFPGDLLDSEGRFSGIGAFFRRMLFRRRRWRTAVRNELAAQIARAMDSGVRISHLNGHQYVEMVPNVAELIPELLQRFQISVVRVASERCWTNSLYGVPRPLINAGLAMIKQRLSHRFSRIIKCHGVSHPASYAGTSHAGRVSIHVLGRMIRGASRSTNLEVGLHPGRMPTVRNPQDLDDGWADVLEALRPQELAILTNPDTARELDALGCQLGRLSSLSLSGKKLL